MICWCCGPKREDETELTEETQEGGQKKDKSFQRKVRLVINTLHLVQKTSSVDIEVTNENYQPKKNAPEEKSKFQTKVKRIINVIKFSTFSVSDNKVAPETSNENVTVADIDLEEEIDVLITPHLEQFMYITKALKMQAPSTIYFTF